MRIDLITTELRPGGAERCLTEIALACHAAGDVPRVICLGPLPSPEQQELVYRLQEAGIELVPLDGRSARNPLETLKVYRRLRTLLRHDRPDVVQTFLYHANVLGLFAARAEGISRRIAGIRVADASRIRIAIERRALRRATAVTCVSESVASFARDSLVPPQEYHKIRVTPNGVSLPHIDAIAPIRWADYGVDASGPVMLFVGRLHVQKGIDWLLATLPAIWHRHPGLTAVLVGEGPLQADAIAVARQMPPGRLVVLGWQPNPIALMKASDLLVLPSRYEGMPNVILEAMAAGVPLVATRAEGVEELIGPAADPQTVNFGDAPALLARIDEILEASMRTSDLLAKNRARVAQCFSIEAMTERFRRLYRE